MIGVIMMPGIAVAQQAANSSQASVQVILPEIDVIGTTPLPPSRRGTRPVAVTPAAALAPTPTESAATAIQPGAIDRDKVPSNVQTLSTADFDHATAPSPSSAALVISFAGGCDRSNAARYLQAGTAGLRRAE
jgi:hypothetical protein